MDLNLLRALITLALFLLFIALCLWAWSDARRADFEAAARLPFDDADDESAALSREEAR